MKAFQALRDVFARKPLSSLSTFSQELHRSKIINNKAQEADRGRIVFPLQEDLIRAYRNELVRSLAYEKMSMRHRSLFWTHKYIRRRAKAQVKTQIQGKTHEDEIPLYQLLPGTLMAERARSKKQIMSLEKAADDSYLQELKQRNYLVKANKIYATKANLVREELEDYLHSGYNYADILMEISSRSDKVNNWKYRKFFSGEKAERAFPSNPVILDPKIVKNIHHFAPRNVQKPTAAKKAKQRSEDGEIDDDDIDLYEYDDEEEGNNTTNVEKIFDLSENPDEEEDGDTLIDFNLGKDYLEDLNPRTHFWNLSPSLKARSLSDI
eukprot:TRINITY_DN3551_c0_g1_i1.p1 TRINITY_DN3551_c0_g1~~TRINITY_DN3551_c0_g1_i1.p1  ORF type:complete len:332 (-),score=57.31 TRINITY_DN3551_c0_g1_i1:551-1519(-)